MQWIDQMHTSSSTNIVVLVGSVVPLPSTAMVVGILVVTLMVGGAVVVCYSEVK